MEVQVKKSSVVRPSEQTPNNRLWNSDLDLLVLQIYMPTVYFYRRPRDCSDFFDADLLKDALSRVLVSFYPMAGRLGRDEGGRLEIVCNAEGVLFVEAETSSVVDDLGDFTPDPKLLQLIPIPKIDHNNNAAELSSHPLLVLQVTNFKCGGVCLGIGLHHVLADGASAIHFINTWADMARGLPIAIPPFMDRTIIRDYIPLSPTFQHIEYQPPPPLIQESKSGPRPTSFATLKLSPDQIITLKAKVNDENSFKYSTFEILAAHLWCCMCKARGLAENQASKLHIPTSGRSRLNPPIPSGYLGNVVFLTTPIALSGEIQSKPLSFAAEKIRASMKRMDDTYLRSYLGHVAQQNDLMAIKPRAHTWSCPNLLINSWTKMPIYEADFGWGRPMFAGLAVINSEGSSYILPSPSSDGSLSVAICLKTHHLQLFRELFYDF